MSDEIVPYSEVRAEREGAAGVEPWPLETLVEAQRMECGGSSVAEIAAALGRGIIDVEAHLQPTEARKPPRQPRANVGFPHLKP